MEQLKVGAHHLGLTITEKQLAQFKVLYELLVEWNQKFNLTAITELDQVQIRHFLDSLSCLLAFQQYKPGQEGLLSCIDIGSGAGFPGLPLKIYCPRLKMLLLEATGKKVGFLQHTIARLGLQHITAMKGRAEEMGQDPAHRELYDVVLARAVADLSILVEYMLPFCRLGGLVIAQKGVSAQEETRAAEYAISVLGGRVRKVMPIELVGLAEVRYLVLIEKVARTPPLYPRRPGMPSKRPLRPKA